MKFTLTIILALTLNFSAIPADATDFDKSIIQVLVTFQEYDPFLPWQKNHPGHRQGYGVVISESRVITTESIVRNHALVELREAATGEKITAVVEISDYQANLALLSILDPEKAPKLVPLRLTDHLTRDAEVEIVQFDETTQIQRGKAKVVQIAVKQLPDAPDLSLTFSLLTDLNISGEGAAVVHDGNLAGLIMNYDRNTRVGTMAPYCVLKHFIDDAAESPYRGFASAGFVWSPLVDPTKRAYLNVNTPERGILVLSRLPGTGASETLQQNDVIMEWDGHAVDNLGFYEDPEFGRLALPYLISGRRKPDNVVSARIIRDRSEMKVNVRLGHHSDNDCLIPDNITGAQAEYLVEGGFIIRELTGRYLQAHGGEWQRAVDPRLVHLYLTQKHCPETLRDRIVILCAVLPDPINIGYNSFRNEIITKVNGESIRNMADVFRIVDRDGSVERVTLKSGGVDLVLDQDELATANSRLARLYRIPRLRYQREPVK